MNAYGVVIFFSLVACALAQRGAEVVDSQTDFSIDRKDLKVDFQMGFGGTLFSDQTNVAVFAIQNVSDRVVSGVIEIKAVMQRNAGEWYLYPDLENERAFQLGQNSSQRFSMSSPMMTNNGFLLSVRDDTERLLWQRYHYPEKPSEPMLKRMRLITIDRAKRTLPMGPLSSFGFPRNFRKFVPDLGKRAVDFMHMEEWALPDHYLNFDHVDGVMLGKEAGQDFSAKQYQALADYVTFGGVLLVAEENVAIMEAINAKLDQPPVERTSNLIQAGLGKVVRFSNSAYASESRTENQHIYDLLDRNPRRNLWPFSQRPNGAPRADGPRATATRNAVLWFVALFTLVTGPVVWMLRHWPRRRFLMVLGGTVGLFSLLAVALGQYLKNSPGELWLTSFTEMSPAGGVQSATYLLSSTGARQHELVLNDPRVQSRVFNSSMGRIGVPLLPWSQTLMTVKTAASTVQPMALELAVESKDVIRLKLDNPNDFYIEWMGLKLLTADLATAQLKRRLNEVMLDKFFEAPLKDGSFELKRTPLDAGWNLGYLSKGDSEDIRAEGVQSRLAEFGDNPKRQHYVGYLLMKVDRSPHLQMEACDFEESSSAHYVGIRLEENQLPPYRTFFVPNSELPPIETLRKQRKQGAGKRRVINRSTSQ